MIVGVGTDLVEIVRLEEAIARTPTLRERLFTPEERRLDMDSLAARFAAKEALAKALDAPSGLSWQDAEVLADDAGRPRLELRGSVAEAVAALGAVRVHLSLSHDGGFAQAFVILES